MSNAEYGNEIAELEEKKMNYKKVFEQGLESLRTLEYSKLPAAKGEITEFGKGL